MKKQYKEQFLDEDSNGLSGLGTDHTLPSRVRDAANIRSNAAVLAWTTVDPTHDLACNAFGSTFGKFLFLPCFWPHMVLLSPCLCLQMYVNVSQMKNQYWILTEYELKVVEMEYDYICCCPGVFTSGISVQTIPLENITDCGLKIQGSGLCNTLGAETPTLYVDTASSSSSSRPNGGQHEALGIALFDSRGMMECIMSQRDKLLGRKRGNTMGGGDWQAKSTYNNSGFHREIGSTNKSTLDRMKELNEMMSQGLVTKEEFDLKRQDILNDI